MRGKYTRFFAIVGGLGAWALFCLWLLDVPLLPSSLVSGVIHAISVQFPRVATPYGELEIVTARSGNGLSVDIACAPCSVSHEKIAPTPLTIAQVQLHGFYESFHFKGLLRAPEVLVNLDTSWHDHEASGVFALPTTEIRNIYNILRSVIPEAATATIAGTISGKGSFTWPGLQVSFRPTVQGFTVDGLISPLDYTSGQFTYNIKDSHGKDSVRKSGEGTTDWVPLKQMGALLRDAVIASEDGAFYSHSGYDISSMFAASVDNLKARSIKRGGSTLSQQLAKNLFLGRERTYVRKLRELLYAVELDREVGKRRVLELYLNVVEWGPEIFGAKQAAAVYFNKTPQQLQAREAAWLASILRSPTTDYERQFLKNSPRPWRANLVLRRMKSLSENERQAALSSPMVFAARK